MGRFRKRERRELAYLQGKNFGQHGITLTTPYIDRELQTEYRRGLREGKMLRLLNGN